MLRVTDADESINKEDFQKLETIIGKKIPQAMLNFYLLYNGVQSQTNGVHDDSRLFPFNSFNSLEEIKKFLTWFDDEVVPEGFKATHLLHLAYDPGSGN